MQQVGDQWKQVVVQWRKSRCHPAKKKGRKGLACEDLGAGARGIREEGGGAVLLGARGAAEGAVPARVPALAVARDLAAVPSQRTQAARQRRVCPAVLLDACSGQYHNTPVQPSCLLITSMFPAMEETEE
jgi:hypothetical protein